MSELHIPDRVGVMILPQCTLFPHGALPLNIFEDHYKIMLEDALNKDPLIAIACRTGPETTLPEVDASPIGTVGLIRACVRDDDERGQLILHGIIRVRFDHWLDDKPYPYARISPIFHEQEVSKLSHLEDQLNETVTNYAKCLPAEVSTAIGDLLRQCDDPHLLADLVSHHFVQEPDARQQALEIIPVDQRLQFLIKFIKQLPPPL